MKKKVVIISLFCVVTLGITTNTYSRRVVPPTYKTEVCEIPKPNGGTTLGTKCETQDPHGPCDVSQSCKAAGETY